MNKLIKVSDYIVNFFTKNNINKCFVVTGGGAMHMNDSFGHSDKIECVYVHHEQVCAMAAEGYARLAGRPALVCVTSGPGSTNAITGVLGSWLDSVPMVVLSGQMNLDTTLHSTPLPLRQLGFQEFNIVDSVKCMTKYAAMITDPKYIAYHLEKSLHLAESGRKGPVWLDIPLDIQSAMVNEDDLVHYDFVTDKPRHLSEQTLSSDVLEDVYNKINNAKKPVIFAGYGIRMSNSYDEFLEMVSRLKIPVVTEWNSNDLIWRDHEHYAGHPGTIGDRGGNFVLQNADLVLAIGCQFSIRQISYAWKNFAKNAYKIGVDVDKYELIKPTIKIDYPIHSDIGSFLKSMNGSKFSSIHHSETKWHKWCSEINNKYPVVWDEHVKEVSPTSVYSFIKTLSDRLQPDDVVVLANGAACVVGLQAINIKKGQRVFTNAGASSMGYGIAASIGAAFSTNKQIICIEGDGSIQMNLQELQTIIHNNLNIKVFWINNGGYHSIKQTQLSMFKAEQKGYCGADANSGISFPSAEKIAMAYGMKFLKVENTVDLETKINEAYAFDGPLICEIVTDPKEEFKPKLKSKMLEDGKFQTPSLEDMYPFLSEKELQDSSFKN